jgi:hypothetical protein
LTDKQMLRQVDIRISIKSQLTRMIHKNQKVKVLTEEARH